MELASLLIYGATDGVRVLGSQAVGGQNHALCGVWFQVGMFYTTLLSIPVGIAWAFAEPVVKLIPGVDPSIAAIAGRYARCLFIERICCVPLMRGLFPYSHASVSRFVLI